ncbi:MAG: cytochrome b/b6 domain-containing protein [Pirellulaceae bacterium]
MSSSGDLVIGQASEGSQLAPRENACAKCHGDTAAREVGREHLYVSGESLAEDVHQRAGVHCHDCHGGDPSRIDLSEAHSARNGFRSLEAVEQACGACHPETWVDVKRKGVHFTAGERDETGRSSPIKCGACHGVKTHGMLPVDDSRSPVFLDHQVTVCGACHAEEQATYDASRHGRGLRQSGLLVTAVCADCHDGHGIFRAADRRSTLHSTNVAHTCGKCHGFIEERLQDSVHGRGTGAGGRAERSSPGGRGNRRPSCTDCHQRHDSLHPESKAFRLELPNRCANCHADVAGRYSLSLHGELTELGFGPAAKCSDCHGAHDILPVKDPNSHLSDQNRLATCQKCHVYAVRNFCDFDPHANHKDKKNYPTLYAINHGVTAPLNWVFGLFLLHAVLWFIRSFIHAFRKGRHRRLATEEVGLVRFETSHRGVYAIMLLSFLGLTLTGLPLKFGGQAWGRAFAQSLGGVGSTSVWHRTFAVLAVVGCVIHLAWGASRILQRRKTGVPWRSILFGPDSPLPTGRDVKDVIGMVRWFVGLGAKPGFERWTYWEKIDYWAVCLATVLIGVTGLILWYPNVLSTVFPGGTLNVATLLHSEFALYLACCLFVIHLFNTHLRPEKFPFDASVITGLANEEHLRTARPDYFERIERAGGLEHLRRRTPSRRRLRWIVMAAMAVLSLGLLLLALVVIGTLGK